MNYYSYKILDFNGKKLLGGCIPADSLDSAARKIVERFLTIQEAPLPGVFQFFYKARPVDLEVGISPDNLYSRDELTGKAVGFND
jgi:hypothetical protein